VEQLQQLGPLDLPTERMRLDSELEEMRPRRSVIDISEELKEAAHV